MSGKMPKILCLYNNDCALELFQWLEEQGNEIILWKDKLNADWCRENNFDLTVSYTYRFILPSDIIWALNNNVVNIHNSLLPFNRGADPNIWSIVERTPREITFHYIDAQHKHIRIQKSPKSSGGVLSCRKCCSFAIVPYEVLVA